MDGPTALREKLIALFALGVLLFSPPLMSLFNAAQEYFGLPLLYLYLFACWAILVISVAVMAHGRAQSRRREDPKSGAGV